MQHIVHISSVAIVHMGWYTSDIVGGGDGDSILCTKQFVGSDSMSIWLPRESPWEIAALTGGGLVW